MIETVIDNWVMWAKGEMPGPRSETLASLLAEDVVFYSPVVFTPQHGKPITQLYLMAAFGVFGEGEEKLVKPEAVRSEESQTQNDFRYVKKIFLDKQAVLEFETTMDGKYVNGVDIISCNDEGLINEFKVMVRPLQAVHTLHAQMGAMLKQLENKG